MGPWPFPRLRATSYRPNDLPSSWPSTTTRTPSSSSAAELDDRYGRAYQIRTARAATTALDQLTALREAGERVALVLSDQWLPDGTGCELLAQARELFPHSRRLLLISWGEWAMDATAHPLRRGIGLGQIDYYVAQALAGSRRAVPPDGDREPPRVGRARTRRCRGS